MVKEGDGLRRVIRKGRKGGVREKKRERKKRDGRGGEKEGSDEE